MLISATTKEFVIQSDCQSGFPHNPGQPSLPVLTVLRFVSNCSAQTASIFCGTIELCIGSGMVDDPSFNYGISLLVWVVGGGALQCLGASNWLEVDSSTSHQPASQSAPTQPTCQASQKEFWFKARRGFHVQGNRSVRFPDE